MDPDEFPLVDEIVEREHMFNLRDSLEEARKSRQATDPPSKVGTLFQGYKFYFLGSNSERITLEQIVRLAGGQVSRNIMWNKIFTSLHQIKSNILLLLLGVFLDDEED